nr:MAG TPA: hypothetical protein [Crassvirales sp.]
MKDIKFVLLSLTDFDNKTFVLFIIFPNGTKQLLTVRIVHSSGSLLCGRQYR